MKTLTQRHDISELRDAQDKIEYYETVMRVMHKEIQTLALKLDDKSECFLRLYKILALRHKEIDELNARLDASERARDNKNALINLLIESNILYQSESELDAQDIRELRDALECTLDIIELLLVRAKNDN